jgi:hypothetical protein
MQWNRLLQRAASESVPQKVLYPVFNKALLFMVRNFLDWAMETFIYRAGIVCDGLPHSQFHFDFSFLLHSGSPSANPKHDIL